VEATAESGMNSSTAAQDHIKYMMAGDDMKRTYLMKVNIQHRGKTQKIGLV
jgi:hypothetical protein